MNSESPAFLIGAGRSGTTMLYKILAAHPSIAYISNYQQRYPNWPETAFLHRILNGMPKLKRRAWFHDDGGAYFNERRPLFKYIMPTPSEAESVYAFCGLTETPPHGYLPEPQVCDRLNAIFAQIRSYGGGKVLLSKRTANNRRIPQLRCVFPTAKFIHIVRDGRAVAYSLPRVAWWDEHKVYWAGDKTPRQLVTEGSSNLELAARNWVEEMQSIDEGLKDVPRRYVLQVTYEDFLRAPVEHIRQMIDFLELDDDETHIEMVTSLNLAPREEPWTKRWSEEEKNKVLALQATTLKKWGYI